MTTTMLMETANHDEGAVYDRLVAALQNLAPEEGIRRIKEFLATFPSFALAHNDLGVLYHRSGNPTLALAHYEKAARLQPDTILFRKNLADFYAIELGWLEEAVDIYLEVVKRNPRDFEALVALGKLGGALSGSRTLEAPLQPQQLESPRMTSGVPALSVKDGQLLYGEAKELIGAGDYAGARGALEQLVVQEPATALYHNDLGVVCYELGDPAAALRCYEEAHRLQPDNAGFVRNLADFYFVEAGRPDDAIALYLDLHKRQPRDVETLISLGHICAAVGRPDEGKTFYRRAVEIEPWNKEAREALAAQAQATAPVKGVDELLAEAGSLMQQGQAGAARGLLEQAVAQNPRHAVAYNDLGVVSLACDDVPGAQRAYERAVELEPSSLTFRKNLADLYFVAAGQPDDAIRMYLELLRECPRDIEVLSSLGQICQAVGRPEEAKTFYRRALEIEPWNKGVREALTLLP